jgi:hypothetical protein
MLDGDWSSDVCSSDLVGIVPGNPPGIDTPEDYAAFIERLKQRPTDKGPLTNG